jgi:hypothetical protein
VGPKLSLWGDLFSLSLFLVASVFLSKKGSGKKREKPVALGAAHPSLPRVHSPASVSLSWLSLSLFSLAARAPTRVTTTEDEAEAATAGVLPQ